MYEIIACDNWRMTDFLDGFRAFQLDQAAQARRRIEHPNDGLHRCLHCKNMFKAGQGTVTPEAAICDVCLD